MSSESAEEKETSLECLSVDIPATYPSSSVDSSLSHSPTGILDSHTATGSPSSVQYATLNVRFAPLPNVAPRKRRSSTPLGVAARAQMMRRRREYRDMNMCASHSMWTDDELSRMVPQPPLVLMRSDEQMLEDPILALGRMMMGAGKHLWRKVSKKDKDMQYLPGQVPEHHGPVPDSGVDQEEPGEVLNIDVSKAEKIVDGEEGREEFPADVGQTETIMEGRTKYTLMTEADALDLPSVDEKTSIEDVEKTPSDMIVSTSS